MGEAIVTATEATVTSDVQAIASEAFATLNTGRQVSPFSTRFPAFDLGAAYRVTAAVRQMRQVSGEQPVGRKIGFTNRTIWDEYQVYAPMWGYVYDQTTHELAGIGETFSLAGLAEPRIEPEVIFRLAAAPAPDMDEAALLACIDAVAHGFE
ncbi:MAG: hydratase, partial [Chloroflexia bacterium]|nr:hydratase [Chloroflexia bacterium]